MDPQGPVQLSFWPSDNVRQEKLPFCKCKSGSVISEFILVVSSRVWVLLHGRFLLSHWPLATPLDPGTFLYGSMRWTLKFRKDFDAPLGFATSHPKDEMCPLWWQLCTSEWGICSWNSTDCRKAYILLNGQILTKKEKKKKRWFNYQWCLQ